ncbi:MAG: COX aromatic rich motif-containing protein, partial [Candidatus Melainabacteria bacterium]|nr:COX aromatic rich motif-containing protein [Candidatus Melainabacteria bacterium]
TTQQDFDKWVQTTKLSKGRLTMDTYNQLVAPSSYQPVSYYVLGDKDLFDQIMMKFMMPAQ